MCYSWRRLQDIITSAADDLVIHWCESEYCNCQKEMKSISQCEEGESKILEREGGCKVVKKVVTDTDDGNGNRTTCAGEGERRVDAETLLFLLFINSIIVFFFHF